MRSKEATDVILILKLQEVGKEKAKWKGEAKAKE